MSGDGPRWEVVGGGDKGGILVKPAQDCRTKALAERLSTGAIIEEMDLFDDRLHYRLIEGTGPKEGWVTTKLTDKDLVVPYKKKNGSVAEKTNGAAASKSGEPALPTLPEAPKVLPEPPIPVTAPRCNQPCDRIAAPLKHTAVLPPFKKYMAKKKLVEAASKRLTGDMYGLPFPQTPEEMLGDPKFGVDWLTKAFHAAGTLPEDNSVAKIVTGRRFEGGGSGPKALFEVAYEKPDENLDTVLFTKMPYPLWENENQRFIEEGQGKFGDNWGGEISFYRFLSPSVPFPCPKYYFGDLCRESTEAVLINSAVSWPDKDKKEFAPYETLPMIAKCEDFLLPNPQDYYFAIARRFGTFTGLCKCGKLGPQLKDIAWHDCHATQDVNCAKGFPGTENGVRTFVEEVAPHWFPAGLKEKKFLDKFCSKFAEINANHEKIAEFLYADPLYVGLFHQNGNTDNCYFYKREDGTIDAGVLDWGSTANMSYGTGFMGSTISGLPEMLASYDEQMVRVWADAYHATGAPTLDHAELLFRYRLTTCLSAYGIYTTANQYASPKGIEGFKAWFKTLDAWNCDTIRADFGLKFSFGMFYNRVMLFYLKGDAYWDAVTHLLKYRSGK